LIDKILENKYGKYAISKNVNIGKGCPIFNTLNLGKVWEEETIKYVAKKINNKSMVHAGVYIGDMLPAFSSFTDKNIYAFEPNPDMAETINDTIKINKLRNIRFFDKGLSDVEDTSDFFYRYDDGVALAGGSRIDSPHQADDRYTLKSNLKTTINTVTIDATVEDEISVIQLDVEGFEIHALKGAMETIRKYKPVIILENTIENYRWMGKNIVPLGYKKVAELDNNNSHKGNLCWECQ